ncbi:MAG: hypothetical protein ACYTG5_20665, partial [Planctomycetota bacterium]
MSKQMANRTLLIALLAIILLAALAAWLFGGNGDPQPSPGQAPQDQATAGNSEPGDSTGRVSVDQLESSLKVRVEGDAGEGLSGVKITIRG